MTSRGVQPIEYQYREIVGKHGVRYLEERDPIVYQYPNRIKTVRTALFLCAYCPQEFVTTIGLVRNGSTQSCGCFSRAASAEVLFGHCHNQVRPTGEKWVHLTTENNYSVTIELRDLVYLGRYLTLEDAVLVRDKYLRDKNPLVIDSSHADPAPTGSLPERILDPHQRIDYQPGDPIGDFGCRYIREAPEEKYRNKRGILITIRNALFSCGTCGQEFETRFHSVKKNNAKSCGCLTRNGRGIGKGNNQKLGASGQKHIQKRKDKFVVRFCDKGHRFELGTFTDIQAAIDCRDEYLASQCRSLS